MKRFTMICDLVAVVAWGSVVWLFANSYWYQYSKGYLGGGPKFAVTPALAVGIAIWIGTPLVCFLVSLIVPMLLSRSGRTLAAERTALVLCSVGVPWAALQWMGLGAG